MTNSDNTSTSDDKKGFALGTVFDVVHGGSAPVLHWKRAFLVMIYPLALLLFDVLLIVGIFSFCVCFRYDVDIFQSLSRRILVVILFGCITGVGLIGGYKYQTNTSSLRFVSEHLIASVGVFIGVFFIIYSIVAYGVKVSSARSVITATLLVFPVVSIFYRYGLSRVKLSLQRGNALCIIGSGAAAIDLCERLHHRKSTVSVMIVDPDPSKAGSIITPDCGSPFVVKSLDHVQFNSSMDEKYVEDYVIACSVGDLPDAFLKRLAAAQFSGNSVGTYESYLTQKMMIIPPSQISMDWVLNEGFRLNKNPTYDRFKRLSDLVFSLLAMIVLSPLLFVTALAVKLTSKGPIIFKQTRVGKHEKPFQIYKFRSMNVGSEKGAKYTAANDSRLTPIGKLLRKSRIDELPQFWNVLKGDLSIIGPRAEWRELVESYEKKFPYYHFRHAIKPGITGWAQVNYSYGQNDKDTMEKFHYDLYYIRKYSPLLDVIIVVKTFYMVIFGRGQ